MTEEQRPAEQPQHDVGPTGPVEETAGTERPPKPVDDPNLPLSGDPTPFEEEPVDEDDFAPADEAKESPEDPIDLSGIDKEFDD